MKRAIQLQQPSSFNPQSVEDLRAFFEHFSGFSGGWAVKLEGFKRYGDTVVGILHNNGIAYSHPTARVKKLGEGKYDPIVVSYDWDQLVQHIKVDALRERYQK